MTRSRKASYMLSWTLRFTALLYRAFRIFATQNSSSASMKPDLEHAPKLPFPPRQSESPKSLEKVELSKCTVFDSMIPSIHFPLHILFYLIGVKTYSHLLSIP